MVKAPHWENCWEHQKERSKEPTMVRWRENYCLERKLGKTTLELTRGTWRAPQRANKTARTKEVLMV